ncbi:hypothetical protein GA0115246_1093410, partial [Streptomyces sp. SolWspMP-sol7th]
GGRRRLPPDQGGGLPDGAGAAGRAGGLPDAPEGCADGQPGREAGAIKGTGGRDRTRVGPARLPVPPPRLPLPDAPHPSLAAFSAATTPSPYVARFFSPTPLTPVRPSTESGRAATMARRVASVKTM